MALLTDAVLVMVPEVPDATVPRKNVVAEVPFARLPSEKLPVQGCHAVPLLAKNWAPAKELGILSVRIAVFAVPGPLFVTVTV